MSSIKTQRVLLPNGQTKEIKVRSIAQDALAKSKKRKADRRAKKAARPQPAE